MNVLGNLAHGFAVALTPTNLLFAFVGALIGTLVGVLPGIGSLGAMSLLLSVTFGLDPTTAIIMFAGIYYGSMYGGSTTSILVNVPGEAASVMTTLDGYQMAKKGRAGAALTVAALGSFVAGTLGVVALMFLAPVLSSAALKFGPPEYFAITVVGFVLLARLSGGSIFQSAVMISFGLLLGFVGMDPISGAFRFTFGSMEMGKGIDFVPVAMGLFGITEVLVTAEESLDVAMVIPVKFRELLPNASELRRSVGPAVRGSVIGFVNGIIPGPAAIISSITSYMVEKKISRHPEEFGRGAVEGVAGPESANNAAAVGAFVPLLTLGVPFAPPMAMMLTALTIHGIQPGPLLMSERPSLFWGVIASMYVGNIMLLVLNLPLVGLFVNLLRMPKHLLMAFVAMISVIGAYGLNNSVFDVWIMIAAGLLGYICKKLKFDTTPLVLALVLGPMMERGLRQALIMGEGSFSIFVKRPISATLMVIAVLVLFAPLIRSLVKRLSGMVLTDWSK